MSRGLDINVPKSCRLSVRICAYIGIGPKGIYVSAKRFVHLMCYVGSVEKSWGFFHVLYVCTSPRHILCASNTPDCGRFSPLVWGYPYNQPLRGCRSSEKPHPSPPLKGREKPFLNPSLKGRTFITLPFRGGLG